MRPLATNKTIPKFRIVLSIPEMKALSLALSKDVDNILENAELIGWLAKQTRKAEFGVMEFSHLAGPSVLTRKGEELALKVLDDSAKQFFDMYKKGADLGDDALLTALQYKAEHSLEWGSLTPEESQVLNEALTKKLLGGL